MDYILHGVSKSRPRLTFTLFSAIRATSCTYLRLLIFLLAVLFPAWASSSPVFHMMYSASKLNKQGDNIQPWCESVCCSLSSSNCCLLTYRQVSQEAGKVVWNSLLVKNVPQFVVIYTVKGFSVVNEVKVDSLEKGMANHSRLLPAEFHGQRNLAGYSPWGWKDLDTKE